MPNLWNSLQANAYKQLFSFWARRHPPQPREVILSSQSRVLIFTCAGIGDTLTDSVVFKALKETFPKIYLAAVVHHRRRPLLEHNPYVDHIFTLRKGPFAFWKRHRQLQAAGPWDAILHLRGNDPEPRCQSFLLNPEVTFSVPNMTHLSHLCAHSIQQEDWDQTHGVEQTLRIARALGADTPHPTLVYNVTSEEKLQLEERLAELHVSPGPRLIFQIGGGRRASWRDWPTHRWVALAVLLSQQLEAEFILLGGSDNASRAAEICRALDLFGVRYHDLVGRLTLTQSAALCATSRCLVSTDTGIMHLGFAVGARVVALIHCNNPASRVGPYGYGDRHRVVQLPRPPQYTSPSQAKMNDILPQEVATHVLDIWKESP